MYDINLSWIYNIILTALVSSIVTILIDRYLLSRYMSPANTDQLCSKFYWEFREFLMDNRKLENPTE